ncbi:MAG: SpoIID/LytB domain-containing protein [Thermodesulfovibrionales bacterium]
MKFRYLLISLFLVLICLSGVNSRAYSEEPGRNSNATIKVLIQDENLPSIPGKDEKIALLGNVNGDFFGNGIRYSGQIEVWRGEKGLYVVNELPLEDYVESVVAAEVGTDWEIEALKAQAVIARTYAVYKKTAVTNQSMYHLTSSVLNQVYKGNNSHFKVTFAVRATEGEILTYNGKPIEALYHSTCGGRTENPEEVFGKKIPYMKSVESRCDLSPYWVWERKIPISEIEKALNLSGIKDLDIKSTTSTGRAKDIIVKKEEGDTTIKATDLRRLLGWNRLPSTYFEIKKNGDSIVFEGKGYGHGVGLCQWSALQMASEGKTYKEILAFFYPGTEIKKYEGN